MGLISIFNVILKIKAFKQISTNELKKAVDSLYISAKEFYIYKLLYENNNGSIDSKIELSDNEILTYYRELVEKLVKLYPDLYSTDDIDLYSKFALENYIFSVKNFTEINLDLLTEILDMVGNDNEAGTLKWYIQETVKQHILKHHMYNKGTYDEIKPLLEELLETEDAYYELIKSL